MRNRQLLFHFVVALILMASAARAQHDGHSAAAGQGATDPSGCVQAQPVVNQIVTAAMTRLEAARQSNSAAAMRAAIDDLQGTLRDLRAQLAPCSQLTEAPSATDPHADHSMGETPNVKESPAERPGTPVMQPGSTGTAPGAVAPGAKPPAAPTDPHAGRTMTPAPASPAAPPAKTAAPSKPTSPAASDPHAEHDMSAAAKKKEADAAKERDPVTGLMVDPRTAPKTTYQGQTYYFSSEQTRKEFLANPAKFAKKSKP